MKDPACTLKIDHDGAVIRIIGNKSGIQSLIQGLASILDRYKDGESIPLLNSALCIYQGGTDTVEYICDDSIRSEGRS